MNTGPDQDPSSTARLLRAVRNPVWAALWLTGHLLARAGAVDAHRAERTTDLAWPRIVTGIARMSKSVADLAMIGIVLGSTAVAGIGIATPFAYLAGTLGGGIAGGTIALVSQRFGADRYDELDLVVKQSVWMTLLACAPLAVIFYAFPTELVGLITDDPEMRQYGAMYLQIMAFGTVFIGLNLIGSRTLVGADDAYSPMIVRAGGALVNIGLNAVLIFGLGMGVAGAALGTVVAAAFVTALFAWGFFGGWIPFVGRFPVTIRASGPYLDLGFVRDLVEISTPIVFTNMVWSTAQFPLLFVVAFFGPEVVAAFVVAYRVRGLMDTPSWGLRLASSSLVGQSLGTGDELEAGSYGRDILRMTLVVYLAVAASVFVFAEPVATVFVDEPGEVPIATAFIRVACLSVIFNGLYGAAAGPLTASGDTRWPFYARTLGLYGVALPVAALGIVTPLGIVALYLSMIFETVVAAGITYYRFASGRWKAVSRDYRPGASPGD